MQRPCSTRSMGHANSRACESRRAGRLLGRRAIALAPSPEAWSNSKKMAGKANVYPVPIINDTRMAALWPSTCLLVAYCGMNDEAFRVKARSVADWILTVQDESGGFYNFQNPDRSFQPLQSGNVNFSASMALWLFNEVYNEGRIQALHQASGKFLTLTDAPISKVWIWPVRDPIGHVCSTTAFRRRTDQSRTSSKGCR